MDDDPERPTVRSVNCEQPPPPPPPPPAVARYFLERPLTVLMRADSTPRILQQPSQRSLTVEGDSADAAAPAVSEVSSFDDRTTVVRWETPPSPAVSPELPGPATPLAPGAAVSPPVTPPGKHGQRVSESSTEPRRPAEPYFVIYEEPGADDDLLDRPRSADPPRSLDLPVDESMVEGTAVEARRNELPIERLTLEPTRREEDAAVKPLPTLPPLVPPKERHTSRGIGGVSPPTPGVDDTPFIRYAINQITREHPGPQEGRPDTSTTVPTFPVERIIPDERQLYEPRGRERTRYWEEPAASPSRGLIFIPVGPPKHSREHPDLTYLPRILHPLSLACLALLCAGEMAALSSFALTSRRGKGLKDYDGDDGARYFTFSFLPQLLAALILLYVLAVETAITRVLPFVSMASRSGKKRSSALLMGLFPTNFILPRLSYFGAGHVVMANCFVVFWLSVLTVPLQCGLFQVKLEIVNDAYTWRWVTVEAVAWTLVALYGLLLAAAVAVVAYFFRRRTGLKWDPTSLADIVLLLRRSNSLADYRSSETFASPADFRKKLSLRSDRLGYWRTRDEDGETFYAIGEEGAPIRTYSIHNGKVTKIPPARQYSESSGYDVEGQAPVASATIVSLQDKIYSPTVRYRFVPWFLRRPFVVAWIAVASGLLLAFIVVSFVNSALLRGFRPALMSAPNPLGFSPTGFLYSFVPSLIGLALFLFWQSIDMRFRALEPFARLASPQGTTASESLLLEYTSQAPVEVTVHALAAGHYKVAWLSFVGLLSVAYPIIGGGLFWAVYFPDTREVRVITSMPALYALVVLLLVYALSLLAIWPGQRRHLPHDVTTLAELISFVYQSPLVTDPAFRDPKSKTDMVTRLVSVIPGGPEPAKYAFGVFKGRDGREHLGIDRLRRPGSDMIVTTGKITGRPPRAR
ncbi:MAG: hypothetical protein M1832_003341 [Thelocarpon impressellum]|nr:MAG: hypothetical protein M1832_003341 [Thelocarpon impressellum]